MTPKERAAIQQALEALDAMLTHMGMDEDEWTKPTFDQARVAITALREALAGVNMSPTEQTEQHLMDYDQGFVDGVEEGRRQIIEQTEQVPVGVVEDDGYLKWDDGPPFEPGTKLYAAPVRTKDLTDYEIADLIRSAPPMDSLVDIARAVIAADREKNK